MRKFYHTLIILVACSLSQVVGAQNYIVSPSNNVSFNVEEGSFGDAQIDLLNVSGDTITFEWMRVSTTLDSSWNQHLCDYMGCYAGIPNSGTMSPVADSGTAFLKVTIGVGSQLTSGTVTMKVWPQGDTSDSQTLTFTASGVVNIDKHTQRHSITLFPNPTNSMLNIEYGEFGKAGLELSVVNSLGSIVANRFIEAGNSTLMDVTNLKSGIYYIRLQNSEAEITERFMILD